MPIQEVLQTDTDRRWKAWEYRRWVEEGLIGEIEDPFEPVKWRRILWVGKDFSRKLKDHWNQRAERPKNYGQKRNWSAVGAEQILERVSEHFQSDLETSRNAASATIWHGGARLRCAGITRIESRRNCGVIPGAQQQFGGSDDSANQDPRRSNSEGLKASNKS